MLIFRDRQYGRITGNRDAQFFCTCNISLCVFRAGKLFAETVQTESVMNALTENAAGLSFTLKHDHIADSVFPCRNCCSQAGRAAADDNKVLTNHTPAASFPMAS